MSGSRGRRRGGARGLVPVVLAAGLLASCSLGGEQATPTTTGPAAFTTETVAGWKLPSDELAPIPPPPAGDPEGATTMLERDALVIGSEYGWSEELPPPQLFDPDTGTWTVLPRPPIEHVLQAPSVVTVPGGFVLLGTGCDQLEPIESTDSEATTCLPGDLLAARYDIADRSWRLLDLPGGLEGNRTEGGFALVTSRPSTGEALVQWQDATWHYDADGDRWARVRDPEGGVCGTDAGFVAVSSTYGAATTGSITARRLQGDGSWGDVPVDLDPVPAAEAHTLVCTPRSVVVIGRPELGIGGTASYALTFDAEAGTWSEGPVPPPMENQLVSAPVDDGAIVVAGNDEEGPTTWHYTEATQEWTPFPLRLRIGNPSIRRDGVFVGDADIFQRRNVTTRTAIRLT